VNRLSCSLGVSVAVLTGVALPLLASGRAVSGVVLAAGLVLVLLHPRRVETLRLAARGLRTPLGTALMVLFACWLVSALLSADIGRSIGVWGRMIGLLAGGALLGAFLGQSERAHRLALQALIGAGLVCLAIALIGIYIHSPVYGLVRGHGWEEVRAAKLLKGYGSAVACLVPVWLWAGWRLGGTWRWAALVLAPAGVVLVLAVDSRAGMAGLAAGALVGAAMLALGAPGLGRLRAGLLASLGAAVVAIVCIALAQLPAMPEPGTMGEAPVVATVDLAPPAGLLDPHRQAIWGFARDRALEAPWFGHGIDMAGRLPGASTVIPEFNQEFIPSHPHNWLLEMFLETGALGAFAMLAALVLLGRRLLALAATDRTAGAAGLALVAAFWCSSFFNFSIWSAWWQLVLFLALGFVLAARPAGKVQA
jgi:O-antigen ligase